MKIYILIFFFKAQILKTQGIKYPDIMGLVIVRVTPQLLLNVEETLVKGELCAARASSSTEDRAMLYKF